MKECCDEIYKDDGRDSDGKDHKGDWGSHSKADNLQSMGFPTPPTISRNRISKFGVREVLEDSRGRPETTRDNKMPSNSRNIES